MYPKGILIGLVVSLVYVQSVTIEDEVKKSTAFTLDMYRALFNENQNTVMSPISFRILLSLVYQTAFGKSSDELQEHIYFDDKYQTLISQGLTLDKLLFNPNIKMVNKAYIKEGVSLNPNFLYLVEQYKSAVEQVNFLQNKETAEKINNWIREHTNGVIENIVSEKNFNYYTTLVLLNTLYFKAFWADQFPLNQIFPRNFLAYDGQNYTIDFMLDISNRTVFKYPEIKSSILELLYEKESNVKFWLIQPDEDSSIMEIRDILSYDVIEYISDNMKVQKLWFVQMPLFEIETEIDGIKLLRKLGVNKIFDDYEIQMLEGDSNNLKVDAAQQKTKITVNTYGTEAGTTSAVKVSYRTGYPLFRAIRPFIYMILMADTNEPLFIGHYSIPY